MLWLLFLFVVVPLVELALLIQINKVVGLLPTVGLVLFTGTLGWWLARREGLRTWLKIQAELHQGRLPGNHLVDALLILVAGAVLITPGVLTDALGFLLLIPPVRAFVRNALKKRFQAKIVMVNMMHGQGGFPRQGDDFVDVEAYEADDPASSSVETDATRRLDNSGD